MIKLLTTGVLSFILGAASYHFISSSDEFSAETKSATHSANSKPQARGVAVLESRAPTVLIDVESKQVSAEVQSSQTARWASIIEEMSYAPYDDLALLKLSIEIAEGSISGQIAFLEQSFKEQNPSEDLQYMQRFLLKNLAKEDVQQAFDFLAQLDKEQRDEYGAVVVKGYVRAKPVEAFNWLEQSAATDTDYLSKKQISRYQVQALNQFVRQDGDLIEAYALSKQVDGKKMQRSAQELVAAALVKEDVHSALSYATTAGDGGGVDQSLVNALVGQWSGLNPQEAVQYLLDNENLIDKGVISSLSQNLLFNGYESEYNTLYHGTNNETFQSLMASSGASISASKQDREAALDWFDKIPADMPRPRAMAVKAIVLNFGPGSVSLSEQLDFVASNTPVNSRFQREAYYKTLDQWRTESPQAVERFVMNLPPEQAHLREALIKRLKLKRSS